MSHVITIPLLGRSFPQDSNICLCYMQSFAAFTYVSRNVNKGIRLSVSGEELQHATTHLKQNPRFCSPLLAQYSQTYFHLKILPSSSHPLHLAPPSGEVSVVSPVSVLILRPPQVNLMIRTCHPPSSDHLNGFISDLLSQLAPATHNQRRSWCMYMHCHSL